jgi:hypothetical protein
MKEKLLQAKEHVLEHKKIYIAAVAGAVVGGVAVYFVTRSSDSVKVSNIAVGNWKPQITNSTIVEATLVPRGHRGNVIRCIQTGELFGSQERASGVMGIDAGNLSKHLQGKIPHVGGYTFENLGENLITV